MGKAYEADVGLPVRRFPTEDCTCVSSGDCLSEPNENEIGMSCAFHTTF
jgi:hypothetical protein